MFNLDRTEFGKDIGASKEMEIEEFRKKCTIKSYEDFSSYIEKISLGEKMFFGRGNHYILQKLQNNKRN